MSKFYYQGHGSYRLQTNDGKYIFVDPFCGDGYDKKADIVLVTHGHFDHIGIDKVKKNSNCKIITFKDALSNNKHNSFEADGVKITAVEAYNKNHSVKECVGYVINLDDVCIYASGDTSKTNDMKEKLPSMNIDYAVLPVDGVFNMNTEEAKKCAELIGAKFVIPVHTVPLYGAEITNEMLFDEETANKLDLKNKIIVKPGREITL